MAFVLYLPIVILYLKEPLAVFLKRKNVVSSIVAGSIWLSFFYVSNMLLPFWDRGSRGGRGSWILIYTTNDIPNKYIYMIFFNDLFIYFVVVVFPLFGASEDLVRDSQRLGKPQEKPQDNISKRAAVEKNHLLLRKIRNAKVNIISAMQSRLF